MKMIFIVTVKRQVVTNSIFSMLTITLCIFDDFAVNNLDFRGFWLKANSYGDSPNVVVIWETYDNGIILYLLTIRCIFDRFRLYYIEGALVISGSSLWIVHLSMGHVML